ncbi:hypothetical protein PI124_g18754 [Phytophthora idaei]|nr:hypothetical protein PI125_g16905 [Phytophthora idaei]KAG3136118.1 hypothetical protein PI126_g17951 [Phytophthora idaei]KAG3236235.1 hypothetical protein PI124_g18754 [Phytophthora idaei]
MLKNKVAKPETHYGDARLAKLLEATVNVERLGNLLHRWLSSIEKPGKNANDVFALLQLNKVKGVELLGALQLKTWYNYVTMLEKNDAKM